MNSHIPSKEEMRKLVSKIYETSEKVKGNIKINTIDDAATLAAYFYGFDSWHEYESLYDKEYKFSIEEDFKIKVPKFKNKLIKNMDSFLSNMSLITSKQEIDLLESNILPLEWLIGKKKDPIGKTEQPVGINTENYIVTADELKHADNFFNSNIEWLLKMKQMFVLFNIEKDSNILKLFENNVSLIGKDFNKFDPIEEAFDNDNFESLMEIVPFDDKYTFPWIWSMAIKSLREDRKFKWTADELLESLKIENLIEISKAIKTSNPMVSRPLEHYLFKQCGIIQENDMFSISEESQIKHHHHIYLLKERLEKINELYISGYFSSNIKNTIKKHVFKKRPLVFLECEEKEMNNVYYDICNITYINAIKQQNKLIKELNKENYKIWTLWKKADVLFNEKAIYEAIEAKDTLIMGLYIYSTNHKLEYAFKKINQIIFLKQSFKTYPKVWIERALNETNKWEENIWFNAFEQLNKLKIDEAFIWQKNAVFVPEGLENFDCRKIKLY